MHPPSQLHLQLHELSGCFEIQHFPPCKPLNLLSTRWYIYCEGFTALRLAPYHSPYSKGHLCILHIIWHSVGTRRFTDNLLYVVTLTDF